MTNKFSGFYIVPTPLGNLADLSPRAADILCKVDWVAAEDTRHSAPLLKHIGARAKLLTAHQHNEHTAAEQIIAKLHQGDAVALISDAGTPGISDPGARIVAAVRAAGFKVTPIPGPCAAITALSAAGLLDEHFLFYGFLPSKSGQRKHAIESLRPQTAALVFYEAPHRILETVADLAAGLPGRTLVIARELTKLFEHIEVLPIADASAWLAADSNHQRGEFVLIVSGAVSTEDTAHAEGVRILKALLADGLPVSQASKLAATLSGQPKKALYDLALSLKADAD